jgi:DNA polymerase-3 subunit alpha
VTSSAFAHLHVHSEYSLLDASCGVDTLVARAAEFGQPAIALTDDGVMSGAVDLVESCRRHGIKPIIGCEVVLVDDHENVGAQQSVSHLTLLAADGEGYRNLCRLVSAGFLEGPQRRNATVDLAQIATRAAGLIALSGCLRSRLAQLVIGDRPTEARAHADELIQALGAENVYFELQRHGIAAQEKVNQGVIRLAHDLHRRLVATADVRYLTREDYRAHSALRCLLTKSTFAAAAARFETNEFFLRSSDEMAALFSDLPEAMAATVEIAARCRDEMMLPAPRSLLPKFPLAGEETQASYQRILVADGLTGRYGLPVPAEARERAEVELAEIERRGCSSYFLILWDLVKFARENQVGVGPGRGSAAGSIVNYALRITDCDPLLHVLLFERFLGPGESSLPDVDIDFSVRGREAVIRHVIDLYGADRVGQVVTFGRIHARRATRDAARVLGYDDEVGDRLARLVPDPERGRSRSLESCMSPGEPLHEECSRDPIAREVVGLAKGLEGAPCSQSIHVAALVVSDRTLTDLVPMQLGVAEVDPHGVERYVPITQYSMRPLEKLGLLKLDLLGLFALDEIEVSLGLIERSTGERPDITRLPLDDLATLELFSRADTAGVFTFESDGMRRALRLVEPCRFDDLVALVAMYRPGALELIPLYAAARHAPNTIDYLDERLRPVLAPTHGLFLYQEQTMQAAMRLAGFPGDAANKLRKAMGKKQREAVARLRVEFVDGARRSGAGGNAVEAVWDAIAASSDWNFNRSHAVSYALIGYRAAWLKAHHRAEFLSARDAVRAAQSTVHL